VELIVGQVATSALGHSGRVSTEVDPFWFPLHLLGKIGTFNAQEVAAAERSRSFARDGAYSCDTPAGQVAASAGLDDVVGKSARRSVLEIGHHGANSQSHEYEASVFRFLHIWGHCDPESKKPYLKRQCIAAFASADLSPLVRRCSCPGGRKVGVHERIEGMTTVPGQPSKVRRSVKSGEDPVMLRHAWARIVKEHLRSP